MSVNFRFKIDIHKDELNNVFKGIAYSNNKIPAGLFNYLNKACHTAIDKYNGKLEWYDTFIRFKHCGVNYTQVKSINICNGCAFHYKNNCVHPYFSTKPICEGKIYKIE